MKTRIRLVLSILLASPILAFSAVMVKAETGSGSTNSGSSTTTTSGSTDDEKVSEVEIETEPKTDSKKLLERLSTRKTELKIKLSKVEEERIKVKCKIAQTGSVSSLSGRIKGIETSRNEVHTNLLDHLTKLVAKLKAKDVDTTKLEAEIVELKAKIATFKADLAKYRQAVIDLKAMDCVSDPSAFKASLESARALRETVIKDATAIKTYVKETIKPTLQEIKAALEAKETDNSSRGEQ